MLSFVGYSRVIVLRKTIKTCALAILQHLVTIRLHTVRLLNCVVLNGLVNSIFVVHSTMPKAMPVLGDGVFWWAHLLLVPVAHLLPLPVAHLLPVQVTACSGCARLPVPVAYYFLFRLRITSCSGCALLPVPVAHYLLIRLRITSGCALLPVAHYFRLRINSGCALILVAHYFLFRLRITS